METILRALGSFSGFGGGGFLASVGNRVLGLADGGVVTRPTLAMIGEGGESEAVIPLSKMGGMGGARSQTIIVELDSNVLAQASTSGMPETLRLQGVTV
jgi:SLT domain-containing protein